MPASSTFNSIEIDVVRAALDPDYEIREELGRGGMAIVYRARERALDREVAIKILPAMLAMDQEFVERFTHEARTAGKLEHPNIVPIYRVGSAGHVIYFVMKLLPGQSLSRVVRERGRLSAAEVRRILIEVAGALGYAAKRHVVHRDIKPDNILLDSEGRCVVTDFGIAKSPGGAITAAGTSLGTPRYMSPEHAQGIPLDGRSDMYSLGVVAYQCLTGKTPFEAEDPFAILYKHINEPLPRPDLRTDEEWALFAVIERMLSKRAEDRFQNADDLITALGGTVSSPTLVTATLPAMLVAQQPTELIPTPTYGTRIKRFWTQDWRSWAGATAIVVGGMVIFMVTRGTNREPSAEAGAAGSTVVASAPPAAANSAASTAASRTADSNTGGGTRTTRGSGTTGSKTAPAPGVTGTKATETATRPPVRPPAFSRCPASTRPGSFTLLVDAVRDQKRGSTLNLNYDVCGLNAGDPYSINYTIEKINQNALRRAIGATQPPLVRPDQPRDALGLRSRRAEPIDLGTLSAGRYRMHVRVTDRQGRIQGVTREFRIVNG